MRAAVCLGIALALSAMLPPTAAQATLMDFELVTSGSEQIKSLVQATNGDKQTYPSTIFSVDLDLIAGTIEITNFSIPDIFTFNTSMSFDAPSVISGTVSESSPGSGLYDVTFSDVSVDFDRDTIEGTLLFDLSTDDTLLTTGGGCGLSSPLLLEGSQLDVTTGHMELVAGVCPYGNSVHTFRDAFRLFIRGNFTSPVPEPGTALLMSAGLVGMSLWRRRNRR